MGNDAKRPGTKKPDPKRSDTKLFLLFSVVFMDMVGFGFIIPLLPDYVDRFGGSTTLVGLLTSAYAAGQFFAAPVVGRLSDRYGRKPLLLLSIGGTFLSLLLLGFVWALPILFVSRLLDGLTGGNITVAQSYIADITDDENRARGLGLIGAAFGLGFILGPFFGGLLSTFGLAAPAFAAAGIAFLNLLLIWFVLPESLTAEARQNMGKNPGRRFSLPLLLETLKTPVLGKLLVIVFFYSFAFVMFETGFSLFAKLRFGLEARQRGYILALVGVLLAAVQGGGVGLLAKRFAERQLLIAAAAIVALSLAAWGFSPSVLFLVIVMAPLSIGAGIMGPVVRSLLSKSVPKEAIGGTLGLSTSIESFNRIVSPIIAALLIDGVGTWAPGLISAVIVTGVCIFALVALLRA